MRKLELHWKIIIAIILACVIGSLTGKDVGVFGITFYQFYDFVGTIFLNALKMLIVPLIMASIITGISGIGDSSSLGRLGIKTVLYYMTTSTVAICIGLLAVNLIAPGVIDGQPAGPQLGLTYDAMELSEQVKDRGLGDIIDVFKRMVPSNIVEAAAKGNMLGLIFFSILFGFFMGRIKEEYAGPISKVWHGVFETMMLFTIWVMKHLAPIGVFGLVAKTVSETGFGAFLPLLTFFVTVMIALVIHMFIILPLILYFIGKVNPLRHYNAMIPAMITAFSTSSSSATLPLTMECVEKNAGVSNRASSFVLPLGATINMDGTALYECVAAMFIAQAYGIELGIVLQFTIVFLALVTSIGVAGIPSASLVAIIIILGAVGLPAEGIGLIMVTDRILDMCRTSVNVFSDSVGAVVIARTEGESGILEKKSFYSHL